MGVITGRLDADAQPQRDASAFLASQLMRADIIIATGAFDADGNKVINADNGAWDTDLLLFDLVSADDDTIDGGDGRDVVFGQRVNDMLAGGEGDGLLFGDNATNVVPFETNIPQIVHGDRLIDVAAGVPIVLDAGGSVVVPDVALETGDFNLADPMLTIVPDVVPAFFESARNDSLQRADSSSLVPYVVTVPDAVHHADALAGNDTIDGQGGDDLIFGNDASFRSPLTSRYKEIRKAIDDVTNEWHEVQHSLVHLSQDYDLAEHTVLGADHAHDVFVGNDVIDVGAGNDMIVGDPGLVLTPATDAVAFNAENQTEQALRFHAFLRDLEHVVVDLNSVVEESHLQVSEVLVDDAVANNPKQKKPKSRDIIDPNHHDLFFSIEGGAGNDVLIGDFSIMVMPSLLEVLKTKQQRKKLDDNFDELIKDAAKILHDHRSNDGRSDHHHDDKWNKHHSESKKHDDIMTGGDGDDVMLGQGGADTIDGEEGNDRLIGGHGKDTLSNDTEKKGKKDSGYISDDNLELTLANPWLDSFLQR